MAADADAEGPSTYRTWRADPDRYIRRVKGGRYQARPHDTFTGERENLGTFATSHQARTAIREFWAGKRPGRPKFVRKCETAQGPRFFALVPSAGPAGRVWVRVGEWFATAEAAAAAVLAFLVAAFGRAVAECMLSRRDTSRRGRRGP